MSSKYNFGVFLQKKKTTSKIESDILKKAALIYTIDIRKDLKDFSEEEIELFKQKAFKRDDGSYGLLKEDRLNIIKNDIGVNNVYKFIEQYNINSTFTNVVKMAAGNNSTPAKSLTNEQIYYAIVLAEIYPDEFNLNKLRTLYKRRRFFKQFEKITTNFAGRKKELNIVNDYVDWLPKSSIFNKISFSLRKAFFVNWKERPPLLIKGVGGCWKIYSGCKIYTRSK